MIFFAEDIDLTIYDSISLTLRSPDGYEEVSGSVHYKVSLRSISNILKLNECLILPKLFGNLLTFFFFIYKEKPFLNVKFGYFNAGSLS